MQEVEQKIMGRVFSLGDRTVESIMTFRSELVWIDTAMTPEQIRERVNREPHNRYPVGEGSLDKLAGVVYLKDLFRHIDEPGFDIRNHLSPAKFFHEGAEVYSALEQLRSEQLGYGIVCDEFGVTRGIVTLKDIFEALVGEIPDSYEEPTAIWSNRWSRRHACSSTGSVRFTISWPSSARRTPFPAMPTIRSADWFSTS